MKVTANRVTAREVLRKMAAPLPGARPAAQAPAPVAPPAPTGPAGPTTEPELGQETAPAKPKAAPQATSELQTTIQSLQQDFFSDEKMSQLSDSLTSLIPMVGPEHSEKLAKVYAKYMEAAAIMKANLAALAVMVAPQAAQMEQLNNLFKEQEGPGNQSLSIGPLT